jgi:hypothetical protein
MGFGDIYNLIFTERQVIFARFTGEVLAEMAQQAKDKSKAEGKGFFGRVNAQMRASSSGNLSSRYLEMAPERIMSESPGNFAMDYSAVGEVKLKKGFENGDEDSIGTEYTDVEFETNFGRYKYRFAQSLNDIDRVLDRFYPGKIRK